MRRQVLKATLGLALTALSTSLAAMPMDNVIEDLPVVAQHGNKAYRFVGQEAELQVPDWLKTPVVIKGEGFTATFKANPYVVFNLRLPGAQEIPRAVCQTPEKLIVKTVRGWEENMVSPYGMAGMCIYYQNGKNHPIFFFADGDSVYGFSNVDESLLAVTNGQGYAVREWQQQALATRACYTGFSNCPSLKQVLKMGK